MYGQKFVLPKTHLHDAGTIWKRSQTMTISTKTIRNRHEMKTDLKPSLNENGTSKWHRVNTRTFLVSRQ